MVSAKPTNILLENKAKNFAASPGATLGSNSPTGTPRKAAINDTGTET